MKKNKKCISGESDDERAFTVSEFFFREQVQFKAHICRVVENFTGYSNI